jgi:hypothetical protein
MAEDHVGKTADPGQVKKAGERAKLTRQTELRDLLHVLTDREGRRFVWRYLSEAGVFRSSFHQSGSVVFWNEGKRQMGLTLLADVMEADPSAYMTMATEAQQDEAKQPSS